MSDQQVAEDVGAKIQELRLQLSEGDLSTEEAEGVAQELEELLQQHSRVNVVED